MSAHSKRKLALTALTGVGALVAANYYISPTSPRHYGSYSSTQNRRYAKDLSVLNFCLECPDRGCFRGPIFDRTKVFETKLLEEAKKMKPNMEDEREARDVDEMIESIFSS